MALLISTVSQDVEISDLGIEIIHPTVNREISLEFTAIELKESSDLTTAITTGLLTASDGTSQILANEYDPDLVLLDDLDIEEITSDLITQSGHEVLNTLAHDIIENSYDEISYNSNRTVSSMVSWDSSDKNTKIREESYTYSTASTKQVVSILTIQYNENGIEVNRLLETLNYDGNTISSITREKI